MLLTVSDFPLISRSTPGGKINWPTSSAKWCQPLNIWKLLSPCQRLLLERDSHRILTHILWWSEILSMDLKCWSAINEIHFMCLSFLPIILQLVSSIVIFRCRTQINSGLILSTAVIYFWEIVRRCSTSGDLLPSTSIIRLTESPSAVSFLLRWKAAHWKNACL